MSSTKIEIQEEEASKAEEKKRRERRERRLEFEGVGMCQRGERMANEREYSLL